MITSSPKFQRKKILITLVIVFIISVLTFFYRNSPPVRYMQGAVQTIFSYPKSLLYSIGKNEGKDDSILLKKNQELEKKLVAYEILRQDNVALKSQFDVSGETSRNLTAAKIIGFQGDNKTPHEFIINVGEKDKIKKGMTVIFQNYFIGKVDAVSRNFSVVITPFNSKFRVLARFPETNASGILVGRDDLMLFDGVVIT
ncbi:MAG: rod shape-determining protein MreC, partial [Candidatus Levybacteria bacterium]|nr:rod shape-determining protein MreC [Candidatus Levybacteria bacterium]